GDQLRTVFEPVLIRANRSRHAEGDRSKAGSDHHCGLLAWMGGRRSVSIRLPNGERAFFSIRTSITTGPGVVIACSSAAGNWSSWVTQTPQEPIDSAILAKFVFGRSVSASENPWPRIPCSTIPYDESLSTIHTASTAYFTAVLTSFIIN